MQASFSKLILKKVPLLAPGGTGPSGPTGGTGEHLLHNVMLFFVIGRHLQHTLSRCSHEGALTGCTGASTNCPAGSEPSACGASGCQTCAAGTASPGGSQPCAACPANTYAATNPAVCTPCPAGYESLPGSTAFGQCVNCGKTYQITPSGLVGLFYMCPTTGTTVFASCDDPADETGGGTCTQGFGFRWTDTIASTVCTTFNITIFVNGVQVNCNMANYLAPATLNTVLLSSAADLDTGAGDRCTCTAPSRDVQVMIDGSDASAYVRGGLNTITFTAPAAVGFSATSPANIYAAVVVNGGG